MNIKESLKVGNTVIFSVDEYRDGNKRQFDGHVQIIGDAGIDVIYLSGYKSRNDFIKWEDVIAKVDMRRKWVKLKSAPFSGNFQVFNDDINKQLHTIKG